MFKSLNVSKFKQTSRPLAVLTWNTNLLLELLHFIQNRFILSHMNAIFSGLYRRFSPNEYTKQDSSKREQEILPSTSQHNMLVTSRDVEVQFLCQSGQRFEHGSFTLKSYISRFFLARNSTSEVL